MGINADRVAKIILAGEDQFSGTFARFRREMDQSRRSATVFSGALAGLVPALSVGALVGLAKSAIDSADALHDMSERTGVAVETLAGLDLAARQNGTSLESVALGVGRLNKAMGEADAGNTAMAESLRKLGVTSRNPEQALLQIAATLEKIQDPTKRAALLNGVFGRSYQELIPILGQGADALRANVEEGKRLSGITKELTDRADAFNDRLATMGILLRANALRLLPALERSATVGGSLIATTIAVLTGRFAFVRAYMEAARDAAHRATLAAGETAAKAAKTQKAAALQSADVTKQVVAGAKEQSQAINAEIADWKRLQSALVSALAASTQAAAEHRQRAADLRAEANQRAPAAADDIEGQASATFDLVNAEQKLLRIRGGAPEDILAQSKLIQSIAAGIADQARASAAVRTAKLAEADAELALAAAEDERAKQQGEQLRKVGADIDTLTAKLEKIKNFVATVTVEVVGEEALDAVATKMAGLGATVPVPVPGKATGGPIRGPGPTGRDSVLMWGAPGEHMLTAREVAAAGGHGAIYALRRALLSGWMPQFAAGGAILRAAGNMPRMAASQGPSFPHLGRIDLGLNGQTLPMYAAPDVARQLQGLIGREALKRR